MLLPPLRICFFGIKSLLFKKKKKYLGSTSIFWKNDLCAKDKGETAGICFRCIQQVLFLFVQIRKYNTQKEGKLCWWCQLGVNFHTSSQLSTWTIFYTHADRAWLPLASQHAAPLRHQKMLPARSGFLYLLEHLLPVLFVFLPWCICHFLTIDQLYHIILKKPWWWHLAG